MALLKCDVCGGILSIDAGGKTATCEFCGAKHSIERMREKVMEIKGTVSIEGDVQVRQIGTREDVLQWKRLLDKYIQAYDYQSALPVVNKILEADPMDKKISDLYASLQELKFFDIRNGVLERYNGNADKIVIPEGVYKIRAQAFKDKKCNELIIPDTVKEWEYDYYFNQYHGLKARKIKFSKNLNFIIVTEYISQDQRNTIACEEAILTGNCDLILPWIGTHTIKMIEVPIDYNGDPIVLKECSRLEEIRGSDDYKKSILNYDWLSAKREYFPYIHYRLNQNMKIEQGGGWYDITRSPFVMPTVVEKITKERRNYKICQYCGSEFTGIFTKVCSKCQQEKDY